MNTKKFSLTTQIKQAIGNRILCCSIIFMFIIIGLTVYDLSISVTQLKSRINEKIKPVEDFAIDQAIIDNLDTVKLKIDSFNENNSTFKIEWVRQGEPTYNDITWRFPFSWVYDYRIGNIAGYHFGYFKVTGGFFSDETLLYELLFRMILLLILSNSILIILYPLAKKIPEKLFINPINRFIDLVSNNKTHSEEITNALPVELEMLETKILGLLKTATEHERHKADIELGHLSARLVHDIRSPLAAMEIGVQLLTEKMPRNELEILVNGIQSVRDIANNLLERYRNPYNEKNALISMPTQDNGNEIRPMLLFTLAEMVISQKRNEWDPQPSQLTLTVTSEIKAVWVNVAPNDVKRLLSNLLNNAYDAILDKKSGVIQVSLSKINHEMHLTIHDNGIGIPEDKIHDVLNGFSLKHPGKGLGLSVANKYMENIGGKLEINSFENEGTEIKLIFPHVEKLSWLPERILLQGANIAIVLDDDVATQTYWQQRLNKLGLETQLFSTYERAIDWVKKNKHLIESAIFIVDYELSENSANGLMFLEMVHHSNKRYLITSHAENINFQNAAEEAGVWLIPKSIVSEIELSL
ncbi:MAG: HAMP domain-containing sensor histidine kinase [Gammaproteobacteria bacterium]|nr:HAMP domain-containing sensor histidine kinase [Gammaproteobacteria bacterium]